MYLLSTTSMLGTVLRTLCRLIDELICATPYEIDILIISHLTDEEAEAQQSQ